LVKWGGGGIDPISSKIDENAAKDMRGRRRLNGQNTGSETFENVIENNGSLNVII